MATAVEQPAVVTSIPKIDTTSLAWRPLVHARTWIAALIWLIGTDLAIYRGGGWAGWAVTFALVPVIIAIGPRRQSLHWQSWFLVCLLVGLLVIKLIWCGAVESAIAACGLAFAAVLSGQGLIPYAGQLILAPFRMAVGVISAFVDSAASTANHSLGNSSIARLKGASGQASVGVALPLLAVVR